MISGRLKSLQLCTTPICLPARCAPGTEELPKQVSPRKLKYPESSRVGTGAPKSTASSGRRKKLLRVVVAGEGAACTCNEFTAESAEGAE
jgi:hypothetical protein